MRLPSRRRGPRAQASSKRRASDAVRLEDPKGLRRALDRVLTPLPHAAQTNGVGSSLATALDALGPELGVRALGWFTEGPEGFSLQRAFGADVKFAERIPMDVANRLTPKERRAHLFLDPLAPGGPVALGLVDPGACAVLRFDQSPHQSLLIVSLPSDVQGASVDFVLSTLTSAVSARALQDRWRQTLEQAAEIQRGLLPTVLPVVPGLEVDARSVAAEEVGGDLFDLFPLGKHTLGLAVGDASGHGLPAALVARDVVVALRVGLDRGMRIAGLLARLNRVLRAGIPERAFATLCYVELESDGDLQYVSAGHPPPLRVRRDGFTALRQSGPLMGPFEHVAYRRTASRLERGETLVLYSDGIVERRDATGAVFGEHRLAASVSARADAPLSELIDGVLADVRAYGSDAPWLDDLTIVVARRTDAPTV